MEEIKSNNESVTLLIIFLDRLLIENKNLINSSIRLSEMLLFLKNHKKTKSCLFLAKLLGLFGQETPDNRTCYNLIWFKKLLEETSGIKMPFLDLEEKTLMDMESFQKIMKKIFQNVV